MKIDSVHIMHCIYTGSKLFFNFIRGCLLVFLIFSEDWWDQTSEKLLIILTCIYCILQHRSSFFCCFLFRRGLYLSSQSSYLPQKCHLVASVWIIFISWCWCWRRWRLQVAAPGVRERMRERAAHFVISRPRPSLGSTLLSIVFCVADCDPRPVRDGTLTLTRVDLWLLLLVTPPKRSHTYCQVTLLSKAEIPNELRHKELLSETRKHLLKLKT